MIGVGREAEVFLSLYQQHEHSEVVALCDISRSRLEELSSKYGIPDVYQGLEICDRDDIDIISIHTPDHLHAAPFTRAIRAGKHVFVEKPMADNLTDLQSMVDAAKSTDRKTMVGQILRFNPLFKATKTMIDEGILGDIFYLEGDYVHDLRHQKHQFSESLGMNWYLEKEHPMIGGGIHPFDILRWYIGCDPVEVQAYANHIAFPEMKNPDTVVAIFKFETGAIAKVTTLYGSVGPMGEDYHVAVYGTKGTVNRHNLSLSGMDEFMRLPYESKGHPFDPEVDHLIQCILLDKPTLCDAIDGAKSALGVICVRDALKNGAAVRIPKLV